MKEKTQMTNDYTRMKLWLLTALAVAGAAAIGPEGAISDAFPTGYEAFYCMRYEVTRRQFADFLNTISK